MGHKNTDCVKNKEDNTKAVEVEKSELGPWILVNNRKKSKSRSRGRSRTKASRRGRSDKSQGQNDRHSVKVWRPKSQSNFEKSKEAGPSGTKQLCDGCCDPEFVGQPTLVILDKSATGTQNEEVADFIGPCPNISEPVSPLYSHSLKPHVEARDSVLEKSLERQHIAEEESGTYRCGADTGCEKPKIGAEGQTSVSFQCADSSVGDDGNADTFEGGGCGKTSKADDGDGDIDPTLSNKDLPSITPCGELRSGNDDEIDLDPIRSGWVFLGGLLGALSQYFFLRTMMSCLHSICDLLKMKEDPIGCHVFLDSYQLGHIRKCAMDIIALGFALISTLLCQDVNYTYALISFLLYIQAVMVLLFNIPDLGFVDILLEAALQIVAVNLRVNYHEIAELADCTVKIVLFVALIHYRYCHARDTQSPQETAKVDNIET
ncbi:hypothetical protein COLO4_25804 [Corchorus olitorius]|uniref:Uncharacterized protein n=1 Tax=Corchorus olitorius TaxID=93759 RepID=A0A1R3HZX8_9ROSI|nr:hypothetical protein COLO4_25804 [Corchorus olitorius]